MPRRVLSPAEKEKMQQARIVAKEQKKAATEALTRNSQFLNPNFWRTLDPEVFAEIKVAIQQATDKEKKLRIQELEKRLADLKGA
jgi:hypothetical protein